jgi:hypothetical protein
MRNTSQQQHRWTLPEAVGSYNDMLLMMGKNIARNL